MWKILFISIILLLLYRNILYTPVKKPNLDINGFEVVDIFTENETNLVREYAENDEHDRAADFIKKSSLVNEIVLSKLGPDYIFADYRFILKKSQLSSCHRDDNGTMVNKNSIYPSYTVIIFLKPMDKCLKVINKSHIEQKGMYLTQPPEDIKCKPGQMIIFDSNLVHAGAFNKSINNTRIQLKLVHRDDIENHPNLKNFRKELNNDNEPTKIAKLIDQPISCVVPFLSDTFRFEKGKSALLYEKLIYKTNLGL